MSKLINPEAYNNPYLKQFFNNDNEKNIDNNDNKYINIHIDKSLGEDKLGFPLIYFTKSDIESWLNRKSYLPNNWEIIVRGSFIHRSLIYYSKKYFNVILNICDLYDTTRNSKRIIENDSNKCKWVMLIPPETKSLGISQYKICKYCRDNEYAFIVHDSIRPEILCPLCNDASHIRYFCINCKSTFKHVKNQIICNN